MEHVPEDWERALAVVAHPDDLEFGAASAIARWTSKSKTVIEVLVTRGEAGIQSMEPETAGRLRAEEQRAAAAAVGVGVVEFLAHRDGIIEYGLPLRRDLARAIRRHRPEVVISLNFRETWPGGTGFNFADHRAVGPALIDAIRDAANPWVFRDAAAGCSAGDGDGEGSSARGGEGSSGGDQGDAGAEEPWQGVRFALFSNSPLARHYVDVTGHLEAGIASLRAHQVYLDNLPGGFDPAGFLRGIAEETGERAGVAEAVPFELIQVG
jgi:LmbE family N-acetylglucosaminyl deacetylase